jgi:predicted nucleic acid-binding protein
MQYVDTSVLVAYLVPETYSALAIQVMCEIHRKPLAISVWTETEFFSALGIKLRTQQLNEDDAQRVQERYQLLKSMFVWLPVTDKDYHTATHFIKHWQTGLRAGDALHLAIAANHNSLLLSLDERLVKAANTLNIPAEWLRATQKDNSC